MGQHLLRVRRQQPTNEAPPTVRNRRHAPNSNCDDARLHHKAFSLTYKRTKRLRIVVESRRGAIDLCHIDTPTLLRSIAASLEFNDGFGGRCGTWRCHRNYQVIHGLATRRAVQATLEKDPTGSASSFWQHLTPVGQ